MVMCWLSERTSIAQAVSQGGPAVECHHSAPPVGKPADSSGEGRVAAESAESADDADGDAILAIEARIEFVRCSNYRLSDSHHEFTDWRVRSNIGARGPPIA